MKHVLLLTILLLAAPGFAQSLKTVKEKSRYLTEEYSVLADNKAVRSGPYKKYFREGNVLLEEGQYENNQRVGQWKFFANGKEELVYDYTTQKVMVNARKNLSSAGLIQQADSLTAVELEQPPLYLASSQQVEGILVRESRLPFNLMKAGTMEVSFRIAATVSPSGAHYRIIPSVQDKEFTTLSRGAVQLALNEVEWVPAVYQGQSVTCIYTLEPITLHGVAVRQMIVR
ncbi:hypothetical protein [Fibrisoma montanum]|uniref:hypothetical protein n=1 Tax=Fibrisoma montanum TaxID=2305895 RepID=UPI0011C21CA3|nr:hypothetical protein [Fibrisoma montanum]